MKHFSQTDKVKTRNYKIFELLLKIGFCALIIGIILIIIANIKYQNDYDKWYDMWKRFDADLSDKPSFPWYGVIGIVLSVGGMISLMFGTIPFITKMKAKVTKETLDYAGEDISKAGVKIVEVATPIINKGAEVVKPIVADISSEIKTQNEHNFCAECGSKINSNDNFCPTCGKKLKD